VVFTSNGRQKEIDIQIGKANKILRELQRSMKTKPELSNTVALSLFIQILTKKVLSQVQAAQMLFCEEFMAWNFATKYAAVEFVKLQM